MAGASYSSDSKSVAAESNAQSVVLLSRRITMRASAPPSGLSFNSSNKTKLTLISIAAQLSAVFPSSTTRRS